MTRAASLGILPARPRNGCYPTPGGRWTIVWRSKAALPQDTAAASRADASRPGHPGLQGWGKQGAGRRTLGLSQQMAPGSLRPAAPREAGELASCRACLERPVLSAPSQQETDREPPAQSGVVIRGEGRASSRHLLLSQQRGGQGILRTGSAPVAQPAKPVHRRHAGVRSPLPVGPQGQQRPEACLECSSLCPAALAPERAPSIHLGLPFSALPFLVALLHGSQSGIFRIPRSGARSWGAAMPGDSSWDARDSRIRSCVAGSFCRLLLRPLVGLGAFFSPAVSPLVGEESFLPCPSLSLEPSPVIAVWRQEMLVHPVLVLASRMALGKSPPLSGPQLPHL